MNNVGPGFTATDRLKELAKSRSAASGAEKDIFDGWAADAPLRLLGEPREVADTIDWPASERASYITGQTVLVDGGMYKGLSCNKCFTSATFCFRGCQGLVNF